MQGIKIKNGELRFALPGATGESYVVPDFITAIADKAFKGNRSLRQIVLPEGLVSIGAEAFAGCTSLESVSLPDSVTVVGARAFSGCTALRRVECRKPENKTIGDCCWSECPSLSSFLVKNDDLRVVPFVREKTMFVGLERSRFEDSGILYEGKIFGTAFPYDITSTGNLYVAFAGDGSREYWWYSTFKEDAVAGALWQARHNSVREVYGTIGFDTKLTFRDVSQICGFCIWGTRAWCDKLHIGENDSFDVKKILEIMLRVAPGAARRFAFVLSHQDDDMEYLAQENHMTTAMLLSEQPPDGERFTICR